MDKAFRLEFMERTSLENVSASGRELKEQPPLPFLPADESVARIKLPEPDFFEDVEVNFLELVEMRTTVRRYTVQEPMSLKELSYLLWCTQGVKMTMPDGSTKRNVPSAGATHPLETYLLINRVEGLTPGLYRFLPYEHTLVAVNCEAAKIEELAAAFLNRPMIPDSAVTFIWAAVMPRSEYRFAERACRYILLDAGHICQNLYLAAQTVQFGCCAIGHFDDARLNQALELDEDTCVVYAATVGR